QKKSDMTDSDRYASSDPNPENPLFANNTDFSDDVAMRDETAVPFDDDAEFSFYNGKHSDDKRGEGWVQCLMCKLWVHGACVGYESGVYICDYSKNSN
ncbi:hypothetical protein HHI36_017386, partial [Cryptolaemus montrouzieri]